jgi:sugar lactone lactonase YvrE
VKKCWIIILLTLPFFAKAQIITTIAGNGSIGAINDGRPATTAEINYPHDVVVDKFGNFYIADGENHKIRKVDTRGIITTIAGTGTSGYNGDEIAATNAELNLPTGIAVDDAGDVYICDYGNSRIRKVDITGIITTIAGNGSFTYNGEGIPATAAAVNEPYGITADIHGNIYFTDAGFHRVREINTSGIIYTVAGNGVNGYSGDGGPATAAEFKELGYINVSSAGDIYVGDHVNFRIRKISPSGIITTFAGNGSMGNSGDGMQATAATFSAPNGTAIDKAGNVYIIDDYNHNLRVVNTSGIISTVAGTGIAGYNGDNIPAKSAQLTNPNSVSVDTIGNVYIADANNQRIRKITYVNESVNKVNNTSQNITIYPNPAHDEINIIAGEQIESVAVLNLIGQTVFCNHYHNQQVQIDVSGLPSGMYLVRINGIEVRKFVKQ